MQPEQAEAGLPISASTRFQRLQQLTTALSEALSFQRVASLVVEKGVDAVEATAAVLVVRTPDGNTLELVHATGHRQPVLDALRSFPVAARSPLAAAVRNGHAYFLDEDDLNGGRWEDFPFDPEASAWAAIPLTVRKRTIGALGFAFRHSVSFNEDDRGYLTALALQCAMAIERAQLHEAESAAREDAEEEAGRFRSLVQELDAIFWEATPSPLAFTFVSARAEAILGYPVARWVEEPTLWADILHPEDRSWAVDFCMKCVEQGQDHVFEYRVRTQDGRVLWLRDIVYVVRDDAGHATKLRGVMVDITAERQGRPATERAARVLPAKSAGRRRDTILPGFLRGLRDRF